MALGPNEVMIDGEVRQIDFFIEPSDTYIKTTTTSYQPWFIPGTILAFREGIRPQIRFIDLIGTAEDPIIIINKGIVDIQSTAAYGLSTFGAKHIRVLGNGDPDVASHGLKISRTGSGAAGVEFKSRTEEFEIAYLDISNTGFCGIMAKSDGAIGWVQNNTHIHHCIIHDTHGEGMYLGETKTPGATLNNVYVYNNLIYNSGWDSFQLRHGVGEVKVYNNTMWHAGMTKDNVQTKGLQIDDNTTGEFYNNIVGKSYSNPVLQLGGVGNTVRNSYFDGDDFSIDPAVFNDSRNSAIPDSELIFSNNWFRNYRNATFLHYNKVNKTIIKDNVYNPVVSGTEFIKFGNGASLSNVELINNVEDVTLPRIEFVDEANGDFRIVPGSYYADKNLGFEDADTIPPPLDPPVPFNLVALPTSDSTIKLNWEISTSEEIGFMIERSLNSTTGFSQIFKSAISSTPLLEYNDSILDAATTYFYKVRSYNNNSASVFSNISSATTDDTVVPPEVPNAPSNLVATAVTDTQINLSWTDNSDDETGFLIMHSLDGAIFEDLASVGSDQTFFSDTGLNANTQYFYKIAAVNSVGISESSNIADVTTLDVTPPGGTVTTVFEFGKSSVMKGDIKGAAGQVEVGPDDVVINNLVITNVELISVHNTQQEALSNSSIQKLSNPNKFVWVDVLPTVVTIREV